MKDVATRAISMKDYLTVYFYSFLSVEEKTKYRSIISRIFNEHHVSDEAQAAIILIQMAQEKQQKSATSSERKERILDHLFTRRAETEAKLNLFRGLLDTFSEFVKVFQCESPLIHPLHSRMVDLVKPDHIPERVSQLVSLDMTKREIQKADKDLVVGKFAHVQLNKARLDKTCHHWVNKLYVSLRSGYVQAAKKLLQLPLTNSTLRMMSVLDPDFVGHEQTTTSFKRLAGQIPVFETNSVLMGQLVEEAARYNVDKEVKEIAFKFDDKDPIDTGYWGKVFQLESFRKARYPALKTLVSALLTVFSGPLVESSFNIMDDILEKDRANLSVGNYEAIAIVKMTLRKKNIKSYDLKISAGMKRACIIAYSSYRNHLVKKREQKQQKLQEKLNESVQQLKAEKAKKVAKLMRLKQKLANGQKCKRENSASSKDKWKRIKTNA